MGRRCGGSHFRGNKWKCVPWQLVGAPDAACSPGPQPVFSARRRGLVQHLGDSESEEEARRSDAESRSRLCGVATCNSCRISSHRTAKIATSLLLYYSSSLSVSVIVQARAMAIRLIRVATVPGHGGQRQLECASLPLAFSRQAHVQRGNTTGRSQQPSNPRSTANALSRRLAAAISFLKCCHRVHQPVQVRLHDVGRGADAAV